MRNLLLVLLLCVGATALKRIIHRIVEEKSWGDAKAYCRQHHTDLLTIRDQAENEEITEDGWIGLYREPFSQKCKWTNGHVNDSFCLWAPGEPDILQYCGFKKGSDTGWHSEFCSSTLPFYCVDEPPVLVKEEKSWEEALEHCRNLPQHDPTVDMTLSYELASPLTLNNVDSQYVFQDGLNEVWIGLHYMGGRWLWLNGQNFDNQWGYCPKSHRCGSLENIGTIHIGRRRCDEELSFLCARKSDMV